MLMQNLETRNWQLVEKTPIPISYFLFPNETEFRCG